MFVLRFCRVFENDTEQNVVFLTPHIPLKSIEHFRETKEAGRGNNSRTQPDRYGLTSWALRTYKNVLSANIIIAIPL